MNRLKTLIKKIKIFTKDHLHLVFKSSAENHLRIQKCKKIKEGEICNLSFNSYSQLKRYQKKVRFLTYSFSSTCTSVIVALIVVQMFFGTGKSQGATFGWLQTDWSGGADTVTTANHTSNQSGWTKFFSKDANVDVSNGEAKIASTSNSVVTTTDADFNAFTKTQTYVSGSGAAGTVFAQKPDGGICTVSSECATGWCSANVCVNPWQNGPTVAAGTDCQARLDAIKVYKFDVGNFKWKVTDDWCNSNPDTTPPNSQCALATGTASNYLNSPQTYPNVDFTSYPAQNACKAAGGRLPSTSELICIYTNRANYMGSFGVNGMDYWSSAEFSMNNAYIIHHYNGPNIQQGSKGGIYSVRCVQGQ